MFVAVLIAPLMLMAQGTGSSLDLDRLSTAGRSQASLTQLLTADQVPTDDVIEPTAYVLGPGDVIAYQTTGFDFSEKLVVVTPENTLLMERYGLINVANMTLAAVRDSITALVKRRSKDAECFVTLKRPRLIYVSLRGNVPYPGTYAVPASMRVSTFLNVTRQPWLIRKDPGAAELMRTDQTIIGTQRVEELTRGRSSGLSPYASRNIVVRHRRGTTNVDLHRAGIFGNAKDDPHLREGDEVMVPFDDAAAPMMSVGGAVANPTTVVYKPGDKVSVLLAAAGGPAPDADLSRVLLIQPDEQGTSTIKVDDQFRIIGEDVEVHPGSAVVVERLVAAGENVRQGVVEIRGEVSRQGAVIIEPGKTRLTDVISRAGGITPLASAALAYVIRPEVSGSLQRRSHQDLMMRFLYSDLTLEDTLRYRLDEQLRLPYVSCDVAVALKDPNSKDNITLQSGDVIVVPRAPDRIYVYGQVTQPGFVTYEPNKTIEWYVDRAGGFAKGAKPGRARIIKGKSKVWLEDDSDIVVQAGDEVYVPRSPDVPAGFEIQTYAAIVGIISSVTAMVGLLYSILR
jgi:protein involved in polysaccharide export with SLBB domain